MKNKEEIFGGINSRNIRYAEMFNKKIEKNTKNNARAIAEKGYSSELNLRGRKSLFEEYFEGTSLEEQNLPVVGPFENIIETESFQNGRERGAFLIKNGFSQEQYENFLIEFEAKYPSIKRHR